MNCFVDKGPDFKVVRGEEFSNSAEQQASTGAGKMVLYASFS